jgi:hypothetical protein
VTRVYKKTLSRKARQNRVCVCEDLDFWWDEPELKLIAKMWKRGHGPKRIAAYFERDPDEIVIALIHLAREEKIIARKTGLKGEN